MIEAVDPIKIDPTSMSNTCKVFDNLHTENHRDEAADNDDGISNSDEGEDE